MINTTNENSKKIEVTLERLKNNPKVTSLMEKIKKHKINIDNLDENQVGELFRCILIANR